MTHSSSMLPLDEVERRDLVRRELSSSVIGDALDAVGRSHQILPAKIRSLEASMVVVGRAMPVLVTAVFGKQPRPFGRLTEALDQLESGEIYLAHGGGVPAAAWGELLTTTARARGSVGAVIHGFHRDTAKILMQAWPVFSRGAYAQDSAIRSAVQDYRVPVEIGGVEITPGDLVYGDVDGVVIVPTECEDEVLERALTKARAEDLVRAAIEDGLSSTAAFAKFGVL